MPDYLRDIYITEFQNLRERTLATIGDLTPEQLAWLPGKRPGNPIGFLVWHMARREDYHLQSRIQGGTQVWQSEGWHQRLGHDPEATGFGFTPDQVREFAIPTLEQTAAYYNRVRDLTLDYLRRSTDRSLLAPMPVPDLPDTSIATYLLARITHEHEHWGQIDYLKGIMP